MEAPVTSGTEAVITLRPDVVELVPSEALPPQSIGDPASVPSFPKVLRRRLDSFFADQKISPKADGSMWLKVFVGLSALLGSWIAIYALRPDSWKFVALYLVGGLAQTFLLLNIAHDSNHNAISSVPAVNKLLNYVFDALRNQLVHVAHSASSRPPLLHQSPGRRRCAYGTRNLSLYPP